MTKIINFCTIKYCILFRGEKTFSDTVLNSTENYNFLAIFGKNIYQYLIVQTYFFNFLESGTADGSKRRNSTKTKPLDFVLIVRLLPSLVDPSENLKNNFVQLSTGK